MGSTPAGLQNKQSFNNYLNILSIMKYVWFNMNNGEFSNSWTEEDHIKYKVEDMTNDIPEGWKMIKYECLNDTSFDLYNMMKIVTNTKK